MSKCVITFDDNPHGVYYNGQLLRGTAVLTTVRPKTVSAIYIQVKGTSRVRWLEKKNWTNSDGRKQVSYNTYMGKTEHFSCKIYVARTDPSDHLELPPGTHSYGFDVRLPQNLPSSVVSKYGSVRYEISLNIDRPNKYSNNFPTQFTIVETVDLNQDRLVKKPVRMTENMSSYCDCFSSTFVEVIADIPFSGYASGQQISFEISIENQTGRNCVNSKVELLKVLRCTSNGPEEKTMHDTVTLEEKPLENVASYSSKKYHGNIEVPSTPPTSQRYQIIDISYILKVTVNVEGKEKSIELKFPIKIGTIPLLPHGTASLAHTTRRARTRPTAPLQDTDNTDSPPEYTFEAPPSYEEAVGCSEEQFSEDDETAKNCEKFVPKYPCYRGFPTPSAPTLPRET